MNLNSSELISESCAAAGRRGRPGPGGVRERVEFKRASHANEWKSYPRFPFMFPLPGRADRAERGSNQGLRLLLRVREI
jgi:hypothetical protein